GVVPSGRERPGAGEARPPGAHPARPRPQPPVQPPQDLLDLSTLENAAPRKGRREDAPLLDHGALLRFEELLLVDVEVEESGDRKEDQQEVEDEEPPTDAREAHQRGSSSVQR